MMGELKKNLGVDPDQVQDIPSQDQEVSQSLKVDQDLVQKVLTVQVLKVKKISEQLVPTRRVILHLKVA